MSAIIVGCDEPTVTPTCVPPKRPQKAKTAIPQVAAFALRSSKKATSSEATQAAVPAKEIWELRETVAALRRENVALQQQLLKQNMPSTAPGRPTPYLPNKSGIPMAAMLPPAMLRSRSAGFPNVGGTLNREQFSELMTGAVEFNPGAISSSERPVTANTPLRVGQEVQLKWNSTWWAATITGFESDGTVRVSYFGWNRSYDEAVPRTDLQLDTNTREKAIQSAYSYQP
ncbi:MAG: hypothetical protein V4662_20060 [Verrucomicrobiota bacterium]